MLQAPGDGANEIEAKLAEVIYSGSSSEYQMVGADGSKLKAHLLNARSSGRTSAHGETLRLAFPADNLVVLED